MTTLYHVRPYTCLGATVVVQAPERVHAGMARLLPGHHPSPGPWGPDDAQLRVTASGDGYSVVQRSGRWRTCGPDILGAALTGVDCLIEVALHATGAAICLHAAGFAARWGVTLIGPGRAGKSVLAACLATQGAAVMGDDAIALIRDTSGLRLAGIGLTPKIRKPFPADLPNAVADFLTTRTVLESVDQAFWRLVQAGPISSGPWPAPGPVVVLDRRPPGEVEGVGLAEIPRPQATKALYRASFAPHLDRPTTLDQLTELVSMTTCFRLTYCNAWAAAVRLMSDFGGNAPDRPRV